MRRIASVLLVVVAAVAAAVLMGARSQPDASGFHVKIAFDNAFGLTEGGDLRVGGVKAGKTESFDVSKGSECQTSNPAPGPPRTCAIVNAVVTESGFQNFKSDASCAIRQQSLIGEYYVDCQPGHAKQPLRNNAILASTHTASTIPPDLVGDVLRRPYRERLRLIIAELGTGLAGRPQDVSELLRKAHPGLQQTQRVLQILGNQRTIIKNFIGDSNTVVRELDQRKTELQRWIVAASRASDVSASRRGAIAAGFQKLPTFLSELDTTMVRLENLTDAQTPLLHNLQAAAPSLNTFLTRLGPFSQASRPAFRSLGDASVAGNRAFRNSADEIATLNQLARGAPEAAKPLRQLLTTLDDRSRSYENNPDAAKTAPPAPDPTSNASGKGFTGFEALLNYAYWQVLALNQFDSISHVLRAVLIQDPQCSNFLNDLRSTAKERSIRDRCNSYLGPSQPGVSTSDFTSQSVSRTAAKRKGERRGAGQPEAGPLPGQTDFSHPQPGPPSSAQQLLQSLTGSTPSAPAAPAAPSAPSSSSTGSVSQVLDYLLAP
jgi:ABC-type transporter Mla subunit MlaD